MPQGYVALILHAHLPFVRHPEYEDFLEEDWLYEAITETYIPMIKVMEGLVRDNVDFRLTMSLTPPLCSMLLDPLLQERYIRHITRLIELTEKEIERTKWDRAFNDLAWFYHNRFQEARATFCDSYGRNLVGAFRKFQEMGKLEIITCGATHGFLPLMMEHPEAIRAQIMIARDHYRQCFGCDPRGIWLPECAYAPGIEKYLQEADIRWFIMDSHGIMFGHPRPRYGIYAPVFTHSAVAAFGRDVESSKQVWSSEEGYPGDADYRDFYRDVGFDLEYDYIKPYIHPDGIRCFTGVKYYRITGKTPNKEPYNRHWAMEKAASHAGNFMFNREKQVEHLHGHHETSAADHLALRRGTVRSLVVRRPGLHQLFHPQGRVRPERVQAHHADRVSARFLDATNHRAERLQLGQQGLLGSLARRFQRVDLSAPARRRATHDRTRPQLQEWRSHSPSARSNRPPANCCSRSPATGRSS